MNSILISLIRKVIFGFIAYFLISWPREVFRNTLYKLFTMSNSDEIKLSKKQSKLKDLVNFLDPIGLFTFIFFDFGWTHSPAIDYSKSRGKKLFVYSLSGILSSFILFFLYGLLCKIFYSNILFNVLYTASKWSLTLGIVSIFPIPPLDGSRMILSFLPSKYYEWYLKFNFYGIIFMLGLLILWILPMIMQPLINFISNVTNFIIF
ncbi:MAG: site-2 protease family protein [Fervidobacterium sp.]|nr:site-2 protease family protein [Fervidobacterium sp.]